MWMGVCVGVCVCVLACLEVSLCRCAEEGEEMEGLGGRGGRNVIMAGSIVY